jgi:serine/threonine-protein kinase
MDNPPDHPVDPLLSQAATQASGAGSAPALGGCNSLPPEFPVKDWDRYEYLGFLGQGGMGMVFLARDRRLGRQVAIKFVRIENPRHVERFMAEARAQARVDHEHVCKVFEVGEVEGRVFITMQHINGSPLDVAARGLSIEQMVLTLRDAARGVHEAHRMGIIHRDLKPSNLMVERMEDGALRTFVMDFGLAQEWNQDITETGSVLGTPAYMSPEQARGEVSTLDRRTDIYSLGATLYHLVTGRPPVQGSNPLEVLSAIASEDVRSMRDLGLDLPRDLEAITLKCLEKERSKRYESARALAEDLDRFLAGEPVQARPTGLWYLIQRKVRKHKQLASVAALALALVLVALGSAIKTKREATRRERLAQHFTEAMGRIESMARYSALSPLHDIRPDLGSIRLQIGRLQEDMKQAGSLANGPGNYALGCGFLTLDDEEKAQDHLQMAWDAGFREPRVAYALALVLGRKYREKLLEAERLTSVPQREARKRLLGATLRASALDYLRRARGSDTPSPAYLEALMAFYEGRLDEALDRLKTLEGSLPWFYEAPLLRGSLLQARAWKRWNQGDRDGAHGDFESGRLALEVAATSGRSAPAVHTARAELELNALVMEKYGQGQVEPAFARGMAAIQTALAAQADHVPALILQSVLLGQLADVKTNRGEPSEELVQRAVATARMALEAGPARADATVALGMAYYQWGSALQEQNLDPTVQLAQGLEALDSLSADNRDYRVENHIGLIHQVWSDYDEQNGKDPIVHLNGAIAAYDRATRMEPNLLPAWINLGTCLQQRAALPKQASADEDLQAALQALDQAQALNPRHFVPYFVRGKVLYSVAMRKRNRGENPEPDLKRSVALSQQGLAINPGIPHLHNGLGMAEVELARWTWESGGDPSPHLARAVEAYRGAIRVAPSQVHGYNNLGDLLLWKARWLGGPRAMQSLREGEAVLQKASALAPAKELTANLGRACVVRVELTLQDGGDAAGNIQRGEALLAKALALNPQAPNALQYLAELQAAAAQWKAQQHRAQRRDFTLAAESFGRALDVAREPLDVQLGLARLWLAQARWERTTQQAVEGSLERGRSILSRILKAQPHCAEALAIQGGLDLEEAQTLPAGDARTKAAQANQALAEALRLNRNLVAEWKPSAEKARKLAASTP